MRGYSDPNVQYNGDTPVWQQAVDKSITTTGSYLNPWYLNYLGGDYLNATQCMVAGSNGWTQNQLALNGGLNNHWATNNTPWSWSFFKRSDLPVHFAINDAFMIADMYQEGVITSTNPNRVTWVSGTVNVSGNSPYIDNNETPGCEIKSPKTSCYPLTWGTMPEAVQDAGVSWQIYQNADNFDDNPLAWFANFQEAAKNSELYERGFAGLTLDTFYAQAANGTLPALSYIVGPTELSEHPPYAPRDGAWLQRQVIEAVTNSPQYDKTVLMISYDETGGLGDHVVPYHSPKDTAGEWMTDPYAGLGDVYTGPGFRVPFSIISPWTRGNLVFTEHADHNSQLLFLEEWFSARGYNIKTPDMEPWRRAHMSNLVSAFDFENPDYSVPDLPVAPAPHTNSEGVYNGAEYCESLYPTQQPPVPYDGAEGSVATDDVASLSENGFKAMRGMLTEGRYLVFEMNGYTLTSPSSTSSGKKSCKMTATAATSQHDDIAQRWVGWVEEVGSDQFSFSSANNDCYITAAGKLSSTSPGALYTVAFEAGSGYSLQSSPGEYLSITSTGAVMMTSSASYFSTYSVTYNY